MCGIVGSVNSRLSYSTINQQMLHRGPDEQNGFVSDNVDLYHLRLSIVDIGGGKQPMHLNNRYTIIFNGEIYNHQQIRQQFQLQGQSQSDTETLLLLYQKFGKNMLHHLEGMFAFAIYDATEKMLFIARDRAGKKPVYYYHHNNQLIFASELNCIKALVPVQMNPVHFYRYLRMGSFYQTDTPYLHVHELKAGSYLEIQCDPLQVTATQWWSIDPFYQQPTVQDSLEGCMEQTNQLLHQAVKRRIESSDLEVGCFLSGGIDSGLITAIASEYNSKLQTFTVSFDGAYNEAPLAKLVADRYGTQHNEIGISFDHLNQDIEQILSNYGEPFYDSSAIPSYYVSKAARQHLTVILNGDGADELFGGYRRYVPFAKRDFFASSAFVKKSAQLITRLLPAGNEKKSLQNYVYRLASLASKSNANVYLAAGVDIFEDLTQHFINMPAGYMDVVEKDFKPILQSNRSGLKKIMNLDFNANLFNQLLVKMDIASMAHSLEGRSPFLCKELLEYAPTIPDAYKVQGTTTKKILRLLAKQYLPAELIHQPKRGFEIPLKQWVNGTLKEAIHDYVGTSDALATTMVQPAFIQSLLADRVKISAEKRAKILWTLFSMEVWFKKVYRQ